MIEGLTRRVPIKSADMSFRKNWLPNLVTTFLLAPLVFKQQLQPWVENLLSQPRDRLMRAGAAILALSVLLLGLLRVRTLWPRVRNVVARPLRRREQILPLSGRAHAEGTAHGMLSAV